MKLAGFLLLALLGAQAVAAYDTYASSYTDYAPEPKKEKKESWLDKLKNKITEKMEEFKAKKEEKEEEKAIEEYYKDSSKMSAYTSGYMALMDYAPATCSGTPYCFPQYMDPTFAQPMLSCPAGFTLSKGYKGEAVCTKSTSACAAGTIPSASGKCCAPCPADCEQKGGMCVGKPTTSCFTSYNACPADCTSEKVCPKDVGYYGLHAKLKKAKDAKKDSKQADISYAPVDPCVYKCCKASTPTYPVKCYDPVVSVETCAPTMTCVAGSFDAYSGKCLVAPGGWTKCPGKMCACAEAKKGKKAVTFCATSATLFGMDACDMLCGSADSLKPYACPAKM